MWQVAKPLFVRYRIAGYFQEEIFEQVPQF